MTRHGWNFRDAALKPDCGSGTMQPLKLLAGFQQPALRSAQRLQTEECKRPTLTVSRVASGIGVEIMGRNKFGPQRGPWADEEWQGWWGNNPPFHTPVIVLTHHPRPTLTMNGGTIFHFVDAEPAEALEQARALAGDLGVRIGGGVTTIRRFLEADLIDQMHIVLVPILLGRGERLWDSLEGLEQRFHIEAVPSPSGVIHLTFARRDRVV